MKTLEAGESIQAVITEGLAFEITNDGWTLAIKSSKALCVRPVSDREVRIVSLAGLETASKFSKELET